MDFSRSHLELIGLVFAKLLDGRAGAFGLNRELRLCQGAWRGFAAELDAGLASKRVQKALSGALHPRFLKALEGDAESAVDLELSVTLSRAGRQRHDGKRQAGLRCGMGCK